MEAVEGKGASRREFLKLSSGAFLATAISPALAASLFVGENNTIRVGLVGCGGRGTGAAANVLSSPHGPVQLVAMADVFEDRLKGSLRFLSEQFGKRVDVPPERQFIGFDAYRKVIDCLGPTDVVLLATPPAFRPPHFEYAVQKGVNVFMEKSFAVDAPGIRRVLKAGELAKQKNLKVVCGLYQRYSYANQDAVQAIRDGMIGDVITCWAYRMHGPAGFQPRRPGMSELMHQIRNFHCFNWLSGGFIVDWLIHNIDVCCWVKGTWPVFAQGQGGRQTRKEPDQMFDHYAVEYHFPDGTRMFVQGRHITNCWNYFGVIVHGSKGCAYLGEGTPKHAIYKGWRDDDSQLLWRPQRSNNPYQTEIDLLLEAIRQDRPHNDTEWCVYPNLVAIMGRMAAESGQGVTWEQAFNSNLVLADVDNLNENSEPPVKPDEQGQYPIAMPGSTKAF